MIFFASVAHTAHDVQKIFVSLMGRNWINKSGLWTYPDCRADFRFEPSQWETALLCNDVSRGLGASLESALWLYPVLPDQFSIQMLINSLTPGRFCSNFQTHLRGWYIEYFMGNCSCVNAAEPIDDQSTLVQGMAWCRQATSHYLSQCWPISVSPYGVTRPQWVKSRSRSHVVLHQQFFFFSI